MTFFDQAGHCDAAAETMAGGWIRGNQIPLVGFSQRIAGNSHFIADSN